ncbi:hypothetical protein PG999_000476, partial [Apiospora kogelbergensis]
MAQASASHGSPPPVNQVETASSIGSAVESASPGKLPHVVIIPQRRPKHRDRGFIRAYAPDLLICGIDQTTFLAFIDGLNVAVAGHPIVSAVNLAGAAVGAVPMSVTPVAGVVGLGVQVVAGVVKEVAARSGQNNYLKKMNDELFGPHGLYCLIMAYDINSRSNVVQFDLGTEHNAAPGPVSPPETPIEAGHSQARFRAHDGILGAAQFPVSAELVFFDPRNEPPPAYEDTDSDDSKYGGVSAAPSVNGNGFWKKLANTAASLQTRQDLKAQVKFVSQGPPSPMRFHMILADFNQYTLPLIQQKKNPTSLISSLLDPKAELNSKDIKKQQKREAKQERKSEKQERKAEKRQRKHPDREPKERKIKS